MDEESNGELAFLETYSNVIMERSLGWYMGSLNKLANSYTTDLTSKQVARKMQFSPCLIEYTPLSPIKIT